MLRGKLKYWKVKDPEERCGHCNCLFKGATGRVKTTFCSPSCRNKARRFDLTVVCLQCSKPFRPCTITRPRTFCSRTCRSNFMSGCQHPTWRGNRRHERGRSWRANIVAARKRDGACVAVGCGKTEAELTEKLSVDHVFPFRFCLLYGQTDGIDPNHLDNLNCMCRSHHTKKTHIENLLLSGDLEGFIRKLEGFIPQERIDRAMCLWGIGQGKQNSLPFDGVPKYLSK